jgi:predicted phosphodiesterase
MQIALLSDIHANPDALTPVLQSVHDLGIKEIILSGDLVGYYYGSSEVMNLLNAFKVYFCQGNHEVMLGQSMDSKVLENKIKETYGSSLVIAQSQLTEIQLNYLLKASHPLRVNIGNRKILVSHGSPWNINEYIYPNCDSATKNRFLDYPETIFILGNTHYQMKLHVEDKLIINPGSVGQSRARFGYAEWATLDLSSLETKFYSTKYPTSRLIQQCQSIDPDCSLLLKHLQ